MFLRITGLEESVWSNQQRKDPWDHTQEVQPVGELLLSQWQHSWSLPNNCSHYAKTLHIIQWALEDGDLLFCRRGMSDHWKTSSSQFVNPNKCRKQGGNNKLTICWKNYNIFNPLDVFHKTGLLLDWNLTGTVTNVQKVSNFAFFFFFYSWHDSMCAPAAKTGLEIISSAYRLKSKEMKI